MKDLIEKLEAATAGSRELGDAVLLASGWQLNFSPEEIAEVHRNGWQCQGESGDTYTDTAEIFMDNACWYPPKERPFHGKWMDGHYRPNPTTSLDAALTLLPKHSSWLVRSDAERGAFASMARTETPRQDDWLFPSCAATAPMALCIAALKARAADAPALAAE